MPTEVRGLSFEILLAYTRGETRHWYEWFQEQPQDALEVQIGIGRMATVRNVIVHIFAVELRCAERLLGEEVTPYDAVPSGSLNAIFAVGGQARDKLERYLTQADASHLRTAVTFPTASGVLISASAFRVVSHYFIHGIRHWAQISTALRQNGYGPQWPHDLLSSDLDE